MPRKRHKGDEDGKFRLLFADHPQPMWVLDFGAREFLEANAAACGLYGYSPEEFHGSILDEIFGPAEAARFRAGLQHLAGRSATAWRHRTKSGRLIDVEIAVHPIDHRGRAAVLAVLMDVTNRRQLEDQLRQAQKMEAVGMLTGGVAHDFNNLLTIISGYSQLILGKLPECDPNRHLAEQIVKAGERAAELTRQLLSFSRRRVLQPKVLDLNQVVGSLATMLQRLIGEDIELRLELGADLGMVHADPGQVEQVLLNLVVNSRDAMPQGGSLTVRTSNVTIGADRAERLKGAKPGPYILLTVSDTGAGMDRDVQSRLFEPFFTTKNAGAGTGLGLFTVGGIIRHSGGAVEVSSVPGSGTSFHIYLPRVDRTIVKEPAICRQASRGGAETILLVEDDQMVRSLVRETLECEGYRILEASDPLQAQPIAESCKGPIQLLITDVIMPKVSGLELARALLARRPDLKVLYMSGHSESAILRRGLRRKEVAFLEKPFTPAALSGKVREVLETNDNLARRAVR